MTPSDKPPLVGAIDVGGTKIHGALVRGGEIVFDLMVPTPQGPTGADPDGEETGRVLDVLSAEAIAHHRSGRLCVVVAVPEYVSPAGEIMSNEVLEWPTQPAGRAELDVLFDSDVRCGAIGAVAELGEAVDATSVVLYVSIGTGLSHTLLIGAEPIVGAHGAAIALGELRSGPGGKRLEDLCSGRGMAEQWTEVLGRDQTTAELFAAVETGHPDGTRIVDDAAAQLAWAIGQVCHVVDPSVVVLGGGLGARQSRFRGRLCDQLADMDRPPGCSVAIHTVGNATGVLGAAHIASRRSSPKRASNAG